MNYLIYGLLAAGAIGGIVWYVSSQDDNETTQNQQVQQLQQIALPPEVQADGTIEAPQISPPSPQETRQAVQQTARNVQQGVRQAAQNIQRLF